MCFDNRNKIEANRGQISKKIAEEKNIQTIFSLTLGHYKKHTICISVTFPYLGSCDHLQSPSWCRQTFSYHYWYYFLLTLWLIYANQTRSSICGYHRNHFCNSSAAKSIKSGRKKILYLRTYKFSKEIYKGYSKMQFINHSRITPHKCNTLIPVYEYSLVKEVPYFSSILP